MIKSSDEDCVINKNPSAGDADGEIYEASRAGRSWEDTHIEVSSFIL